MHRYMHDYFKELIALYKRSKPLWQLIIRLKVFSGLMLIITSKVFSRLSAKDKQEDALVIVCNFTKATYENYKVGVPDFEYYNEILNSDAQQYGGSGQVNKKRLKTILEPYHNQATCRDYNSTIWRIHITTSEDEKGSKNKMAQNKSA